MNRQEIPAVPRGQDAARLISSLYSGRNDGLSPGSPREPRPGNNDKAIWEGSSLVQDGTLWLACCTMAAFRCTVGCCMRDRGAGQRRCIEVGHHACGAAVDVWLVDEADRVRALLKGRILVRIRRIAGDISRSFVFALFR